MNNILLIEERPKPITGISLSDLTSLTRTGTGIGGFETRRRLIISLSLLLKSSLTAFWRCFYRSDRITDCFRNGLSMCVMPIVGIQVLVRGRQPKARSIRARLGITIMSRGPFTKAVCITDCFDGGLCKCGLHNCLGTKPQAAKVNVSRDPVDPEATFKAICITQTRTSSDVLSNNVRSQRYNGFRPD